jgi:AraC-like DNA-binding protein/mannose-6-phosphate isomerase-like protein (cupin superfamily)
MSKMSIPAIKTYSTQNFRERYMRPEQQLDLLLKPDFGTFFIVPVEEMIRLIKLPVPPTRATNHLLIYLTEGEALLRVGSESYRVVKEECLVVPAGQVFSFAQADTNRGYLCNFHSDFLATASGSREVLRAFEFLQVWGNHCLPLGPVTGGYAAHLLKRMHATYAGQGLQDPYLLGSYLLALLCEIRTAYRPLAADKPQRAVALTNRFKELLFTEVRTRQRVGEYAAALHVTPNHLNKAVKGVTGKSPSRWIDETLVLEAKVLLHQTDLSVGEVAAALGLFDASYFSRLFKKHAGTTPVAFRKKIEKSPDRLVSS